MTFFSPLHELRAEASAHRSQADDHFTNGDHGAGAFEDRVAKEFDARARSIVTHKGKCGQR
jgi:hypothetical protein